MAKCPHCEKPFNIPVVEPCVAKAGSTSYKSIMFSCPLCHKVLSCQIDPLTLNAELLGNINPQNRQ